jgi:hypothetical protein
MEGIMNLPANVGGATSQDGLDSFAPLIAAQQAARDMGYPRFTRELLSAGSEMDQAEVQEFLQTIRDAGLTSEDVALMRRVVEAVFGDPNNYPEVRARLLAEGVPEDILPETFDLEFFVALRMAVEEAENLSQEPRPTGQEMPMDMPLQMAEGGIVRLPQMTPIAREMAAMGRNGDTMLAHITPQEAMMLKRMGGSGTINPYTGLPEFFIGKLFKGLVKGIKKFAKSTIGRIVISVALGAFLGPAAAGFLGASSTAAVAAVSGAVGGFGSSILAGDGLKAALRNGLTGAVLAGGTAAITGGSAALQARPGFEAAYAKEGFLGTVKQTAQNYFGSPVDTAKQMYGTDATPAAPDAGVGTARDFVTQPAVNDPTAQLALGDSPYNSFGQGPPRLTGEEYFKAAPDTSGFSSQEFNKNLITNQAVDPGSLDYSGQLAAERGTQIGYPGGSGPPVVPYAADAGSLPGISPSSITGPELGAPFPRDISGATTGAERGFFDKTMDFFSPSAREAAGKEAAERAFQETLARTKSTALAEKAYQAALPGTVSKYLPIVGTTLAATGGLDSLMKVPEGTQGKTTEEMIAESERIGQDYLRANPQFAGTFVPSYYPPPTYRAAEGSGPKGVENFPRKTGAINGPGTGTSDDIPAMLSDGEFVFTARSVRNMGGGSRRKGAAKMYKLMKMLEGGPVGKTAKA